MSLVVEVDWGSFAARTEIGVMAYGTLVADTGDIDLSRLVFAERSIAVDTRVSNGSITRNRNPIVNGYEAMVRMNVRSRGDTG